MINQVVVLVDKRLQEVFKLAVLLVIWHKPDADPGLASGVSASSTKPIDLPELTPDLFDFRKQRRPRFDIVVNAIPCEQVYYGMEIIFTFNVKARAFLSHDHYRTSMSCLAAITIFSASSATASSRFRSIFCRETSWRKSGSFSQSHANPRTQSRLWVDANTWTFDLMAALTTSFHMSPIIE
jgi:hypothetical protein